MEPLSNDLSVHDFASHQPLLAQQAPHREKTKRPQLSCNPCRARKVKCDRIQPCTACSLHQIAEICRYDLSESERQPILQAEALKEKDKAIAQLRIELSLLRGEEIKAEAFEDSYHGTSHEKVNLPPRSPKKSSNHGQKQFPHVDVDNMVFFQHPQETTVADEFANLSVDRRPMNIAHAVHRGSESSALHIITSHPFPTLWSAQDDTSTITRLLPPEQDLYYYIEAFQARAQACSFPYVPEECTTVEVKRFIDGLEHNAACYPDMLALLFATLAQGVQNGIYDKDGEKWVAGSVEAESKKGDVYIAASMQCLRLASFLNRPTLLAIEALLMIGPYLTNSGKFLDASALFGITVRLAQSIGLHRHPNQLSPPVTPREAEVRKTIWWWMLHIDQQYSMALGRPLAISSIGDCPLPESVVPDPVTQSIFNFISQYTLLSRQILSAGQLSNDKIDKYTDDLLMLQRTLPPGLQLDITWLNKNKPLAGWPLDVQAGMLHAKTHNLLILLNRGRTERIRRNSEGTQISLGVISPATDINGIQRGRKRVLESCRALLCAFEFLHTRLRAAMIHWAIGQMAFNASMVLTLAMLETGETQDLLNVQHAYSTFLEMNKLGIHKLAGVAVERLGTLMKEFRSEDSANETVMGQQGMMLLELPEFKGTLPSSFAPLGFHLPGASSGTPTGHRSEISHIQRKRMRRGPVKAPKKASKPARQLPDRRFSDNVTPRPSQRHRGIKSTPNLSLQTSLPGQSIFTATSTPAVKSETLFPPTLSFFDTRSPFQPDLHLNLDNIAHPQSHNIPSQEHQLQLQHTASESNDHAFGFSTQSTPYSTEFFDNSLPGSSRGFEHRDPLSFDHQPYSAPPFSLAPDGTGFTAPHF